MAARRPEQAAIKVPDGKRAGSSIRYLTLSYGELNLEVEAWMARFSDRGVRRGDRVLVMVRQGLPLIASAFALFQLGAVPIIIDPGMGRKNFLSCVASAQPRVLLGIPTAQILSRVFRPAFRSVEVRIWVSGSTTACAPANTLPIPDAADTRPSELAAILFTSGSTGAPKGVCYEHGMFDAQVRMIREAYTIEPGEVDLPLLPIFALFAPALGLTSVIPHFDPSRPGSLDPAHIVAAIRQENVTMSFGSPTLWRKIVDHCLARRVTLPSLRRVLCAGAPVPASLWDDASKVIPNGRLHSPYGATEMLPVASVSSRDFESRLGYGTLVGRPLPGNCVRIIRPVAGPITSIGSLVDAAPEEIGEIIATGPTTTKSYDARPEATAAAKILDGTLVWHRLGDAGRIDADGRLWFCGRLAERVETANGVMDTEPCEQFFRDVVGVRRCALIGLGNPGRQEPALVVEPTHPELAGRELAAALREVARSNRLVTPIRKFFFHPSFPVDVRHNAKIHRLTLTRWAATAKYWEPPDP